MTILKCKMCGGDIIADTNATYGTCDSCGTTMTLPKLDDEQQANRFNRANHFRRQNEFDKAIDAYEKILADDNENAEAHWGVVLSRYGIEYVEDPMTHERIPTCNRVQAESILADSDYRAALEYAEDGYTRSLYEEEAKKIAEIQKGILAISRQEDPYDVFICYKETSTAGTRTKDSALAQDIYYQLTGEGYKVFFSRITLEDKLGREYEPYIFAALNSAKVMVVVGTSEENYNAPWVKNEWSRYLALMRKDRNKLLIPCYRDMDPYDMPEELSMLQSQDMSKIGFIQDLIRGIKKVISSEKKKEAVASEPAFAPLGVNSNAYAPLLRRANMYREDGDFASADEYYEKVLDINPECAEAYWGKLMTRMKANSDADYLEKAKAAFNEAYMQTTHEEVVLTIEISDELKQAINKVELNPWFEAGDLADVYAQQQQQITDYAAMYRNAWQKCKDDGVWWIFWEQPLYKKVSRFGTAEQIDRCDALKNEILNYITEETNRAQKKFKEEFQELKQSKEREYPLFVEAELKRLEERFAEQEKEKEEAEKRKKIRQKKIKKRIPFIVVAIVVVIIAAVVIKEIYEAKRSEEILAYHSYEPKGETQLVWSTEDESGDWNDIVAISAGSRCTMGVKRDGTVIAIGDNDGKKYDVRDWNGIVAISAGGVHTVGLKKDGTVVATGVNNHGECNVQDWNDIVAISAGGAHTVGLKKDGTVVTTGVNDFDVQDWNDIVAISAGGAHTVGLKKDGTVIATGVNAYGQCDVQDWNDIMAISVGNSYTVGLKRDGTVIAVGYNTYGLCDDVQDWDDIVAISAGESYTVGLKRDGTVTVAGDNSYGQFDVQDWDDIVAISAGESYIVGLMEK